MYKYLLKFIAIAILLLLLTNFTEDIKIQSNSKYNSPPDSTNFDTLYVRKLLKLTSADSLIMHFDKKVDYDKYNRKEYISLDYIKGNNLPFYIRTIISTYPDKDGYFSLGSFRILYKSIDNASKVHKISKDSIEAIQGALSIDYLEQQIIDVNYDGYKDIIISFTQNTTGRNYFNYFFTFDSVKLQFIPNIQLDSMFSEQSISIDDYLQEISTGDRIGYDGFSGENYRWNGKTYELYARNEIVNTQKAQLYIKEELKNGKWETVEIDTLNIFK